MSHNLLSNGGFWLTVIQLVLLAILAWYGSVLMDLKEFRDATVTTRWTAEQHHKWVAEHAKEHAEDRERTEQRLLEIDRFLREGTH